MNKRQRKKAWKKYVKRLREARLNFNRARQQYLKAHMWERVAEWEELKKTIDPKVIEQISKKIEEAENRMITEATKAVYGVE